MPPLRVFWSSQAAQPPRLPTPSPPPAALWDARVIATVGVLAVAFSVALLYQARLHGENLHAWLVGNGNSIHFSLVSVPIALQLLSRSDPVVMLAVWCFVLSAMFFLALFGDRQLICETCFLVAALSVSTAVGFALYHSPGYSILAVIPVALSALLWKMFNNL